MHEDYKLTPSGHLGGMVSVSADGKFLGEFTTTDKALAFVREHMEEEQFWASIWWVSDHGNAWMIDLDGNEVQNDT
jgi:hypothetical protein